MHGNQPDQRERYAVTFDDVRFTYDGVANAVDGVSFGIPQGQFACIVGGNGSGKSTLAKLICALLVPTGGAVRVCGFDAADGSAAYDIRQRAGLVMQNPDDQLVASIVENDVAFGPENLGIPQPDLRHRVDESLAAVGLADAAKRETHTLSGGQKQRVAIAGVLAMRPDVLVLDEATAMLDPRGRADVMRICAELRAKGLTIVAITHFMDEAALADRVIALDRGRIVADGTTHEVLTQPAELAALALDAPFACKLSQALIDRGVPLSPAVTEVELEEQLCALLSNR